jgi:hypothetical protein
MASIIEMYEKSAPKTSTANLKGKDKTQIEPDGGLNLATDEAKLKKARGGVLNSKLYSDTFKKK